MNDINQNSYVAHVIEEQLRAERNALSEALGESLDEIRRIRTELNALKEARVALSEPGDEP